jgi:hypothetical protein
VDKSGRIVFRSIYHLGEQPDNEDVLEVLRRLSAEEKRASIAS